MSFNSMDYLRRFFTADNPSKPSTGAGHGGYSEAIRDFGKANTPKDNAHRNLPTHKESKERKEEKAVPSNMTPSDSLQKILDQKQENILDEKTKQFQDYYLNKSKNIFPDAYQQDLNGRLPAQNPIKTYLNRGSTSYLSGLPKLAYERQIDVDRKYVREGHYVYGAQ